MIETEKSIQTNVFSVDCATPRFCCESGRQGDPKCKGKCIPGDWVNDGGVDCSHPYYGVDEKDSN